jgi:hypothetical protein
VLSTWTVLPFKEAKGGRRNSSNRRSDPVSTESTSYTPTWPPASILPAATPAARRSYSASCAFACPMPGAIRRIPDPILEKTSGANLQG